MATEILIGTSGYAYTDWVGPVYPEGIRREELLARYSLLLRTVELNVSFYRMPTASQFTRLMKETDEGFRFSIKANEGLTHRVDPGSWRSTASAFVAALQPLRSSGRLAGVLLQFPPSFLYDVSSRRYLDLLLAELAGFPLAVEFRCPEWYNNRVFAALRSRRVSLVSLDLPDLPGLPPAMDIVTAPLVYIRLHGRDPKQWRDSGSSVGHDYLYSDLELEAWADRIRGMTAHASRILVYFNTPCRGQAVANAKTLARMLVPVGALP